MKYIYGATLYARYWWLVCIKAKSATTEEKHRYYEKADKLEQKLLTEVLAK
jgi:DNA polymerase elongation subunit (family B)